ncbi:MAG: hypothetical protein ACSHX8_00925 [Opitutaceae bacterium]
MKCQTIGGGADEVKSVAGFRASVFSHRFGKAQGPEPVEGRRTRRLDIGSGVRPCAPSMLGGHYDVILGKELRKAGS